MKGKIVLLAYVFALSPLLLALFSDCCLCQSGDDPPEWRNQKQSALVIPPGGYISLQAEGMDNVSLRKAVLSTNETGTWRNQTEYAFLWKQEAVWGLDNFGTATYKDGILYAPSKGDLYLFDDNVYAINASNGDIIWNKTVIYCDASPCIDGDVIYVGEMNTANSRAMALDKTTGEEVWHFIEPNSTWPDNMWVGSPVVHSDYVYYTTYGAGVYALNKTNGQPIWHQDIGDLMVCSAAYHEDMVFVSAHTPPGQYAFNATTGEEIWHVNRGSSWDSSPVVYDGMIIQGVWIKGVPTDFWKTYTLNETNGGYIRRFSKGSPSTPLAYDGKIFIPDVDWRMWAFDLLTGEELWHTVELHDGSYPGDESYCSPAAAGGAIYYQSTNGTFYVINETDGGILWRYRTGHGEFPYGSGSTSVGDGCVFVTNDSGLYAFKIGPGFGDWPMFCQNNLHRSVSEHGIEYVRWPLTQPKDFEDSSNVWMTAKFIWCNKTITSAAIAWRIYFFDSAGNTCATDIRIFYVEMHNVAIVNVVPEKTVLLQNEVSLIEVIVVNEGDYTETFNVTVYANTTIIEIKEVTLTSGDSAPITFAWNTTGFTYGKYTISAYATQLLGEAETDDNTYINGIVTIRIAVHDVAVSSIEAWPSAVPRGQPVYINVTGENQGDFAETFNVIVYADQWGTSAHFDIGSEPVSLDIGESSLVEFVWDTTGVPCGTYWITAEAILPEDADPGDNVARTKVGGICVPYNSSSQDIIGLLIPIVSVIFAVVLLGVAALGLFKILMSPKLRWP